MAKYCSNCGFLLPEGKKFCGNCGTPCDTATKTTAGSNSDDGNVKTGNAGNIAGTGLTGLTPEQVEKVKKIAIPAGIAVIVILAAAVVFTVVSNHTGVKGFVREIMDAYEDYDIDTLMDISSEAYDYVDADVQESYFKNRVGDDIDLFEDSVGHNYKLSWEINEIYTMSERKSDELFTGLESSFDGFDTDIIEEVQVAKLTVSAKQDKTTRKTTVYLTMTLEDGEWRLLYIEDDD